MAKASYLSQPLIQRIPVLLREVRDRIVVIPRFQRPFVWTDQQRLDLMESIYQGLPIGSLLLWRTTERGLETYQLPGTRAQPNPSDGRCQYLLDGHQRVTTLFTALGPGLPGRDEGDDEHEDDEPPLDEDDNEYRPLLPLYFDLESKEFRLKPKRGKPEKTWLALNHLFDDHKLFEYLQGLARLSNSRNLISRARRIQNVFFDYMIPVIPLETDDLGIAVKSFERVNSAGTRMSEVHMVNAFTYAPGRDLDKRMQEVRDELEDVGWQDLDEQMILNVCKAELGLDIHSKVVKPLVAGLVKSQEPLDHARDSLLLAAKFLARSADILGPQTLPYSYQIVLIADVLWRHVGQGGNPEALDEPLARWLWATTYGEYFAGMNSTRLRHTLDHLHDVASGKAKPLPDDLAHEIAPLERFDYRAARSRAMALTIARLRPFSPRKKRYRAFRLLARHGWQAIPLLLSRHEVGTRSAYGFENRIIAEPGDIKKLRTALQEPGHLTAAQLASHGIPRDAAKALHASRYADFLAIRRQFLLEQEKQFVEKQGLVYDWKPPRAKPIPRLRRR